MNVIFFFLDTQRNYFPKNLGSFKINQFLPKLLVESYDSNRIFILGFSNTALSLWNIDLTMKEFVECEEFRIIGEESILV